MRVFYVSRSEFFAEQQLTLSMIKKMNQMKQINSAYTFKGPDVFLYVA